MHQTLCETHASRSWQTKEKRGREHRQLQSSVCKRERPGPQEDTQDTGNILNPGPHHLHPELKYQLAYLEQA